MFKRLLYEKAFQKPLEDEAALALSTPDLAHYLFYKGGAKFLRGLFYRYRLKSCGRRFLVGKAATLLFPRYLSVGEGVTLGDGLYLNCFSKKGIRLHDRVRLREYVWAQATSVLTDPGVGLEIGENTYIGPYTFLGAGGGIMIGKDVTIGACVHILAENHAFEDTTRPINAQGVTRRGIVIEDDCWIGNLAVILDGVTVGRGSVIGAAAVVTQDVPPYSVAAGNPARVLRARS